MTETEQIPQAADDWRNHQDDRTRRHIAFAQGYVRDFGHGASGHLDYLTIDTLAKQMDTAQETRAADQQRATDLWRQFDELRAAKDGAYAERNKCLVLVALMAQRLGLTVGIGQDPTPGVKTEWRNILFIELPAGQVSWHLHESETSMFYFVGAYDGAWDGHDTAEKYRRVLEPGL